MIPYVRYRTFRRSSAVQRYNPQDRDDEVKENQRYNDDEGTIEVGSVSLLQAGKKRAVRLVLQDVDADQAEIEAND